MYMVRMRQSGHEKLPAARAFPVDDGLPTSTPSLLEEPDKDPEQGHFVSRHEEIDKLHRRAASGNAKLGRQLTIDLREIDALYLQSTSDLYSRFEEKRIDIDKFDMQMANASFRLFQATANRVGAEMAEKIYPGCLIGGTPTDGSWSSGQNNSESYGGEDQAMFG